jgi:hypothetical protein
MNDVWHKTICKRSKTKKRKCLLIFVKIVENQTLFIIPTMLGYYYKCKTKGVFCTLGFQLLKIWKFKFETT